jgi:hypothetical protein
MNLIMEKLFIYPKIILLASCITLSGASRIAGNEIFTEQSVFQSDILYQQDTLSKEEKKELKRQERARKKAEAAEIRLEMKSIDNPNNADYILLGKNLPSGRQVLDAISGRVPGVIISGNSVMIGGPNSFYGGMSPLFLVDDVEVGIDYFNAIPMEEIERIEVFTGSSAAFYGSRVGNGVFLIYTKFYYNNIIHQQ